LDLAAHAEPVETGQHEVEHDEVGAEAAAEIDALVAVAGGLDSGADDYVTKPFSPRELMARVRAVLRRADAAGETITSGALVLDPASREVTVGGAAASLTRAEFSLLQVLMRSPGRAFTREELIARAFGDAHEGMDRTIDAHIKNLRRKIDPSRIVTVFGVGYKFS